MSSRAYRTICILVAACASLPAGGCVDDFAALRLLPPILANAPNAVHIDRALPYAEHQGRPLLLDLYQPASAGQATPLVIVVFGAGWHSGSRAQLMEFAYDLAAAGYTAAAIDYRLADETCTFPAQVIDVVTAVQFLRENAPSFGIDPDRVALLGASAGAHLSLLAGMAEDLSVFDERFAPGQSAGIKAVVNLFGPTDLTVDPEPEETFRIRAVETLLGSKMEHASELRQLASPIAYVRADGPAVFTVHGDADTLVPVSQARSLVAAMQSVGQANTYIEFPGMGHTIAAVWISNEAQSYRPALFEFLAAHL